ncbi:hypothetical protein J5N97_027335 [Dioscorea zingiberensis]|uniref:Uncharacterized protein n=1 Tax=Dioscorea zingiberensis TaxID=325984 RepID=A0A9D5H7N9_9LILI|nr:hypothetical protein J5N97_027335 [Dioscorea zingiberensis]
MDGDFNPVEVLELVLREPMEDWLVNLLFLAIPVSSPLSPCLVRTMLIRRLTSDLSFLSTSEYSLQSLEYLHRLHHRNDPSYSLRAAYCSVAVECTVSFLRSSHSDDDGEFFSAVKRICNCRMEDLVTAEETAGLVWYGLERARRELEQAVVDSRVMDALKKRDTKKEALEALRVYLREETLKMGPPFLMIRFGSVGENENSVIDPPLMELKDQDSEVPAKGGVCGTKINPLPSPEMIMVKEGLRASFLDLQRVVRDPLPDAVALVTKVSVEMPANMWDEKSGDSSSNESQGPLKKPHLPRSKKRAVSPLKIQENSGFAGRRKKLRWTPLEEDTLRSAVKRHGKGNWKLIKSCHPEIFEYRTEVDLKDKWRNLTRN